MLAKAKAKAEAAKAAAEAKAEALDKKHSISDKANKARADASAKADAFDKKHGLTEKGEAATKAINTHVGAADKKYGVSDKVNATTAAAAAKAAEVSAAAGAKYDEKMYGDVYKTFQEFDADGSGELDNAEVKAFCLKLGMALTDDEVVEALGEIDSDGDGFVQFEEFAKWFMSDSKTKEAGTMAFRLLQAKENAYAAEMAADTPMGRLLAAKASAGESAAAASASAKGSYHSAKASAHTGYHKVTHLTEKDKAKYKRNAGYVVTVASLICPAGRAAKLASKGMMAYGIAEKSKAKYKEGKQDEEEEAAGTVETMTLQLTATAAGGESMVFSAPGYVGDYSVAVPAGLAVGDTFQFDGDLVKEAPPREKKSALDEAKAQAKLHAASAEKALGKTKLGKQLKTAQQGSKMASQLGIKPKDQIKIAKKLAK